MSKAEKTISIDIDPNAGFCFGVENAIEVAENYLQKHDYLYCLGQIVHNQAEVNRLESLGLKPIDRETFGKLTNETVLIRAHGEPEETYRLARENNLELLEGTCPIVLQLQETIHKLADNSRLQVVIYGKPNHPEAIGLASQFGGHTQIGLDAAQIDLDFCAPIRIYSQTTMDAEQYAAFCEEIYRRASERCDQPDIIVQKSVCGQVANRGRLIRRFAQQYEVIVFVSGKNSSNGKFLYDTARHYNSNTYFISSSEELDKNWFKGIKSAGISGATSTPAWLMEEVKEKIIKL